MKEINLSVRTDALSKKNMLEHEQRIGDFTLDMRFLGETRREILKQVEGIRKGGKMPEYPLFSGRSKVEIIWEGNCENFYKNFLDSVEGRKHYMSLLDVGCGKPDAKIAAGWGSYAGIDLFDHGMRQSDTSFGGKLALAEATYLPFRDRAVDFAVAYAVIPLLKVNAYFAITELARVARKGIAFTAWHEEVIEGRIAKGKSDTITFSLPTRGYHAVKFDCGAGIFDELDHETISIRSGDFYFSERGVEKLLGNLGFEKVNIFVDKTTIVESGKEDKIVNGKMEVIALKR